MPSSRLPRPVPDQRRLKPVPSTRIARARKPVAEPGTDAQLVVVAVAAEALCMNCLVKKTAIARPRVERALVMLSSMLAVKRPAICHACLDGGTSFRLA